MGGRHRRTQEHRVGARHRQPHAGTTTVDLREQLHARSRQHHEGHGTGGTQQEEELLANVAQEVRAVREGITGSSSEDGEPANDE